MVDGLAGNRPIVGDACYPVRVSVAEKVGQQRGHRSTHTKYFA